MGVWFGPSSENWFWYAFQFKGCGKTPLPALTLKRGVCFLCNQLQSATVICAVPYRWGSVSLPHIQPTVAFHDGRWFCSLHSPWNKGPLKWLLRNVLQNGWRTETIHQSFQAKQKSRHTHITTTSQTQQLLLMSQDLFDCYVSVTALNLRYHSAGKVTADRLSKNARHNIYATLDRVRNARTLVLLYFLFYNIIRFLSTLNFQENCVTKPFPSSDIAVE